MSQHEAQLRAMYDAFNDRDLERALAALTPDVDWPNGWEGGRLAGKDAVRAYWTRQWAAVDPVVTPRAFADRPDGRVAVALHQLVRDHDGKTLSEDGDVKHVYAFEAGLVVRMDIET